MKIFVLASLVAAAAALPQIKNVGRTISVSGSDVKFTIEDGVHTVSSLKSDVQGLTDKLAERLAHMTAVDEGLSNKVAALREDTNSLMDSVANNFENFKTESTITHNQMVKSFADGIANLKAQTTNMRNGLKSDYDNKFNQFSNGVDALNSKVDTKISEVESRADNKFSSSAADYNNKITASKAKITAATIKADKLNKDLLTKKDKAAIVWIGGSKGHMYSGWRTMPFDRTDIDASGSHFEIKSNYFLIKKPGIYRLCLWTIQHGTGGHRYIVRINGNNMMNNGHNEGGDRYPGRCCSYRNFWEDIHIDQTWHFKANERVEVRIYSPQYGMHGGSNRNSYNRLSFTWIGSNAISLKM